MTATATSFLNKAREQVGFREGRNNDNYYGRWYGMNYAPYCAIGLTWVGYQVGAQDIMGGKWAYCPYWAKWWRDRGQWAKSTPGRGDIVFFDWTGRQRYGYEMHVGVVLGKVDQTHIQTVEFNTMSGSGNQSDGGGVYQRTRHISNVVGYGKPQYAAERSVVDLGGRIHTILVIDGVWGARTTKRLQQVLRVVSDGEMGPTTYRAMAVWLGQTPTGTFTLKMKTALQHRVGVKADGVIGPATVRALQRYLNRL